MHACMRRKQFHLLTPLQWFFFILVIINCLFITDLKSGSVIRSYGVPKRNYAQLIGEGYTICANLGILLFCATALRKMRWIGVPASICYTNTTNLTVRWGGDRRWTLQQIAGLPEVLKLIKQMPGGIISTHQWRKWQGSEEMLGTQTG